MRTSAGVTYVHSDHLRSTAVTSGVQNGNIKYFPYGATRSGAIATTYKFTGQRLDDSTGLYYYGARYYDAALGRFIQADTIVPQPGNPQALNRYSYVLNNPLRYIDPSGHEGCAPGDQACWVNEWNWKNRWYNAHGYFWGGDHWSVVGDPVFADEGITNDVIAEAGITLQSNVTPWPWTWANKKKVAYGVAKFGQKLSKGIAGLKALLGGYAVIILAANSPWYCSGNPCAPPSPWADEHTVYWPVGLFSGADLVGGAQAVVHELAHIIDWHSNIGGRSFSQAWPYGPITGYAKTGWPQHWERWAEAVTTFVFPGYKSTDPVRMGIPPDALQVQMDRIQALLEGWY